MQIILRAEPISNKRISPSYGDFQSSALGIKDNVNVFILNHHLTSLRLLSNYRKRIFLLGGRPQTCNSLDF